MAQERSGAVTTIAILHLIGGGMGLIVSFCWGGWLVLCMTIPAAPLRPGNEPDPSQIHAFLRASVPGYMAFQAGNLLIGLAFDVLLISAGVGLLYRQPWARWATIVWAGLSIVVKLATFAYLLALVYPAMETLYGPALRHRPGDDEGYVLGITYAYFGAPCTQFFFIVYPLVVLVVLFLPRAARDFAPGAVRDEEEEARRPRRRRGEEGERDRWEDTIRDRWNDPS